MKERFPGAVSWDGSTDEDCSDLTWPGESVGRRNGPRMATVLQERGCKEGKYFSFAHQSPQSRGLHDQLWLYSVLVDFLAVYSHHTCKFIVNSILLH